MPSGLLKYIKTKMPTACFYFIQSFLKSNTRPVFTYSKLNTRTRCKICSKLTIKTPERRHWRRSSVFIVNFEDISHLVLVLLLATLNMEFPEGKGLELVSLPCFVHDFWRKVFLLLYSINWTKILLSGSFYFVTQQASLRHLFLCLF